MKIEILNGEVKLGVPVIETFIGRVYECIEGSCCGSVGAIVLRTSCSEHPFVNLNSGQLWGNALNEYRFVEIKHPIRLS